MEFGASDRIGIVRDPQFGAMAQRGYLGARPAGRFGHASIVPTPLTGYAPGSAFRISWCRGAAKETFRDYAGPD
ncbi:hypothetical protein GCM10020369_52840 [Cryptosporangium minutisporangium]|uniref:Uncharacterized protein n=1 Tax=Cryptosporangium minutisporangium TaxID=113569 RepID=A0ABP6T3C9_9ACTN